MMDANGFYGRLRGIYYRAIYRDNSVSVCEQKIIESYFDNRPGAKKIMIDVGAHVGSSAHPFAKKGWDVYCFEPEKSNYEEGAALFKNNPRIKWFNCAISDIDSNGEIFYTSDVHWGIHSLKKWDASHKDAGYMVPVKRLSTIIKENDLKDISFLKIDIEGADFLALKGFPWDDCKPEIVMTEFMDSRSLPAFGYSMHDMVAFMVERGYECLVSEWGALEDYGIRGKKDCNCEFMGFKEYTKESNPVWGNLIFYLKENEDALNSAVATHMKCVAANNAVGGP